MFNAIVATFRLSSKRKSELKNPWFVWSGVHFYKMSRYFSKATDLKKNFKMHKITLFTQDIHDNSKSSKCQKSCDPGFAAVLAVISCFGPKPLYFVENGAKVMTKDYLKQVLEPVLDTLN